jgi:streptogramin lyase
MKILKSTRTLLLLIFLIGILTSCSKSGSNPTPKNNAPSLAVSSLSVTSGPYTTSVVITGTGFSSTITDDKVYFNGVAAVISHANATTIYTTVPFAAGTGAVTVTVNGNTATGPTFTYVQAQVVSLFITTGPIAKAGVVTGSFRPKGIGADAAGNVYVADQAAYIIRKITPAGIVSTFAGSGQSGTANGPAATASFTDPRALAVDGNGNVYVCDNGGTLIRKITPQGVVSTLAGNLFNNPVDGTGSAAGFGQALALAVDGSGNIFVADQPTQAIRKITPAGVVTTLYHWSGSFSPYNLAVDKSDNVFAADGSGGPVFKITSGGVASIFAGGGGAPIDQDGTGNAATFILPFFMTIDANGNLYVSDSGGILRKITPNAVVTTFSAAHSGLSDGPIATASFLDVEGITIDANGNFYVIDGTQIRKITVE